MKKRNRLLVTVLSVSLVFALAFSSALSEGLLSGDLTSSMLFFMIFSERAIGSEAAGDFFHVFSPLYSDGHWVTTYYTGGPAYVQVLTTSATPDSQVCAVRVVSDGEESNQFRALCAYAMEGLVLTSSDQTAKALEEGVSLDALAEEIDIASAGYTFTMKEDGTVPYALLETGKPYTVEQKLDIPTDQGAMYPLPADTMSVEAFVDRLEKVLADNYGMASPAITHLDTSQEGEAEWGHVYLVMDMVLRITADEASESSAVRDILLINVQDNAPALVMLAEASFGALSDFSTEQIAAMGLVTGARTTFNDFLSFLPTIAHNGMMLLFGMSQEYPCAYIMGTP